MENKLKFSDYLTLFLKIDQDNLFQYFQDYLDFLVKEKVITKKDFLEVNNNEAKKIFIELLIIAIVDEITDVIERGNLESNLESLKLIWEEIFPELEVRLSSTYRLFGPEEKTLGKISKILKADQIIRLSREFTGEVVEAPTRMTYYSPKPVLSEGGIHDDGTFLPFAGPIKTGDDRIDFFTSK